VIRTPWVAAALLALAACAPKPETPEQAQARMRAESDSAKAAIDAADARFVAYIAAGKADSAALNYAEDAVFYVNGSPPASGRAAIQAAFQQMLGMGSWRIAPSNSKVEANGPLAVETGTYVTNVTPGPHAPAGMAAMYPDSGNFLTTWRKVDGRWLITHDMSATTRAPAPAKKR
jgi:ketosteroid isomerase-like protein